MNSLSSSSNLLTQSPGLPDSPSEPFEVALIPVHDGIQLAAAIYKPQGDGPFPTLFAASPYRFDNNRLPAGPQFMYRETGPIDFYLSQGYAYVHLDVRGTGRSEGVFEFLGPNEQQDLYDAIEWVGRQLWCTGKVGSIGMSYYCMSQWMMGIQNPPSLACIGATDGMNDPYRSGVYNGGILNDFFIGYWWYQNRFINLNPLTGVQPRMLETDLTRLFLEHPTYDHFWQQRCAWKRLPDIRIPVYSYGFWVKSHNKGNLEAFKRVSGPIKLKVSGIPNAGIALTMFESAEFHQRELLPFYDHYLKGVETATINRVV